MSSDGGGQFHVSAQDVQLPVGDMADFFLTPNSDRPDPQLQSVSFKMLQLIHQVWF